MKLSFRGIALIASLAVGLCSAPRAFGAAAVKLGHVSTSVGLSPNTAANQWKLIADPVIACSKAPTSRPSPNDQIFVFGSLSATYDPTILTLATVNRRGQVGCIDYQNAVQGLGDYQVVGFNILTNNGGYYAVDLSGRCARVTKVGNVGGGEAGEVFGVQFQLNKCSVKTVPVDSTDQNFFELNLFTITGQGTQDPGAATIFANQNDQFPDDSITIGLRGNPFNPQTQTVVPADDIDPDSTGGVIAE